MSYKHKIQSVLIALCSALVLACSSADEVTHNEPVTQEITLDDEVRNLKRELPITDDSGLMTIRNIYVDGSNHVKMEAHLNTLSKADINMQAIQDNKEQFINDLKKGACQSKGQGILKRGIDITLSYFDKSDNFIIEARVTKRDCPNIK